MLFSVFGEEYVVFCTFKKSCAGWLVMQGISRRLVRHAGCLAQAGSRSLDHYAKDLAAQDIVSDNIEGWRKGKATKNPLKR